MVRSSAAALGGTIYDRLRINAVYALQARAPAAPYTLLVLMCGSAGGAAMSPLCRITLSMPVVAWVACHWHVQLAPGILKGR